MDVKLFTDIIEAAGKVASGLKRLGDIPQNEREKYYQIMDDTYRLLDTTLNMVIIRLGEILNMKDSEFEQQVAILNNFDGWFQAERAFRLCASLRKAIRETNTLRNELKGRIAMRDWDELLRHMNSILAAEDSVAEYLGNWFSELSRRALAVREDKKRNAALRSEVGEIRDVIIKERQQLIRHEIDLFSLV